jgi:hypothetical protein
MNHGPVKITWIEGEASATNAGEERDELDDMETVKPPAPLESGIAIKDSGALIMDEDEDPDGTRDTLRPNGGQSESEMPTSRPSARPTTPPGGSQVELLRKWNVG